MGALKKEDAIDLVREGELNPAGVVVHSTRRLSGGFLIQIEREGDPTVVGSPYRLVDDLESEVIPVAPASLLEDYVAAFEAEQMQRDTGEPRLRSLGHSLPGLASKRLCARKPDWTQERAREFLDLVGAEPDRYGLLRWLADRVGDAEIEAIAKADYHLGAAENEKALRRLLEQGSLPDPIDVDGSNLREVCGLSSFFYEDKANHLTSALGCAVLILACATGEAWEGIGAETLDGETAELVHALQGVDDEARALAVGMLGDAMVRQDHEDWEPFFCALGIVAIRREIDLPTLHLLLDWEAEIALHDRAFFNPHLSAAELGALKRDLPPRTIGDELSEGDAVASQILAAGWAPDRELKEKTKARLRPLLLSAGGDGAQGLHDLIRAWKTSQELEELR